jgi:hypothetical protein
LVNLTPDVEGSIKPTALSAGVIHPVAVLFPSLPKKTAAEATDARAETALRMREIFIVKVVYPSVAGELLLLVGVREEGEWGKREKRTRVGKRKVFVLLCVVVAVT